MNAASNKVNQKTHKVQNTGRNSHYANKRKSKGRRPVAQLKRGQPVFTYYVTGTDIEATKIPCERTSEDRSERKFSQSTLGTWKNPKTGRKCKVQRVRNKPVQEETDVAEAAA